MKIVRVSNSTFVRGEDGGETYSREYYVEGKTVQDIADIAAEYGQTDDTLYLYDDAGELIAAAMWPQTGGGYRYCYGAGLDPNPAWRIWRTNAPAQKKQKTKNFTAIDIAQDLINRQSMELENGKICYYLHIGEDGNFTDSYRNADCTLCVERTPDDYGFEGDDWTPDDIYARESLDDAVFMGIVSELTDAANNAPEAQQEETFYFPDDANIDKIFGSICPYCLTLDELRELYRGWSIGEPTREAGEWTPGKTFDQWLEEDFHEATRAELDKHGTEDNPPEDEENEED